MLVKNYEVLWHINVVAVFITAYIADKFPDYSNLCVSAALTIAIWQFYLFWKNNREGRKTT